MFCLHACGSITCMQCLLWSKEGGRSRYRWLWAALWVLELNCCDSSLTPMFSFFVCFLFVCWEISALVPAMVAAVCIPTSRASEFYVRIPSGVCCRCFHDGHRSGCEEILTAVLVCISLLAEGATHLDKQSLSVWISYIESCIQFFLQSVVVVVGFILLLLLIWFLLFNF